ncbi:hypothetical protein [Streptomyces sp. NPDC095817]|uniref:hypothetical protein n=1 Tax=Streptomyces sp. NPDC095817 TaxID=3155082 RepID=UPI00331ED828
MLSHKVENGVLVLNLEDESRPQEQDLAALISDMVHVHAHMPAVIVLGAAVHSEVIKAVLEAHHLCRELKVLIAVATPSAPARRVLQAESAAQGGGLVVYARADIAVATADADAL